MKRYRYLIALAFFFGLAASFDGYANVPGIKIIPQPVSVQPGPGVFKLSSATNVTGSNEAAREIAGLFAEMVRPSTGYALRQLGKSKSEISFSLNKSRNAVIGNEGYVLTISPSKIEITANAPAGLFYGMQTIMQLLPNEIVSPLKLNNTWNIPCVQITDFPRFGWRGLMLDVSRHFFSKDFVKKYIDQLVKYKMNVFHWHLTDDQGWRIEIKSLPKLTAIGAWRAPRMGKWWTRDPQFGGEEPSYGGYYTQDDIREIVHYASARYVTILPEIDVPGHSMAALAAYPELSCTGGDFRVNVGNRFYTLEDNALCAGNEQTYAFMDKVLSEVAALFPGQYIHIGGDECYKGFWKGCSKCNKKMVEENLKSVDELQSYFIKRMEKTIISKGKRLIGWDEILEGGLAPEAAVMSWRGFKGGIEAAKMNHPVVMTPTGHCYLDLYQGDPIIEPPTYSMLRLNSAYNFDPVPEGVDPALILGGQGNLWTESVPNIRHAEYMTWPRAFALAESLWSPKAAKNWENFVLRVEHHFKRFDIAGTNYATSMYDAIIKGVKAPWPEPLKIALSAEVKGMDLYYSFDGTYPDQYSSKYTDTLSIPRGADLFRVVSYRKHKPVGKMISISIKDLEARK
ncbi:hexosaminidase [Pedobacter sp. AK017]|uniref:beta-N-acetylhexosaminidase n=1 Tax=Pedobacter sp. AK017 TaxID=2723073 RepID=UPI001616A232|nr:family 20 glycosylhydrolase [Pedobacter sp. AK017]MBB5438904.1 hexosaminidase [Pedobacter sp. AK017]